MNDYSLQHGHWATVAKRESAKQRIGAYTVRSRKIMEDMIKTANKLKAGAN